MRTPLACAIALTLLTACSVGPTFETPTAQLPQQWNAAWAGAATQVENQWWKQFGDPTLDDLIARARTNNLDLRVAALRVAQARAQRGIVSGQRWPSVGVGAGYQRERQSEVGVATRTIDLIAPPAQRPQIIDALSQPFDVFDAGFDASWEIDLWGRARRAVESADANTAAIVEQRHDTELTLIAEVARTYLELLGTREQLRIAREDVAASQDQLELTVLRVKGGLVPDLDREAREADLATARASIPSLEQAETQLQSALALMLGESPATVVPRAGDEAVLPATPTFSAGIPSELARRRPDIRRAEAKLAAATADVGVATADLYPRFSLTGSFHQQSLDASDITSWGARQWSIGPSLTLPIFQGGRLHSTVELRKLQQQQAAIEYQRAVLGAWHEVENALSAYAAEKRRNDELVRASSAASGAYDVARIRYERGLTNYLVDLDANRTKLRAQRALADSNVQLRVQLVALAKAVGGGWEEEVR